MTKLSDGDTLTDLTGTELVPVITTPGVAGGNDKIPAANFFTTTAAQTGISQRLATALFAGANVTITDNGDGTFTISAGAASSYTDENAMDAVAAALVADPGFTVITYDDTANTITVAIDPSFKNKLSGLIQANDAITATAADVRLPGTAGAYVSATTGAGQIVTGNLTVTARVKLDDWTPAADNSIFGIYGASGNFGFRVRVNATTGTLSLIHSVDGTAASTATATVASGVADGTWIWIKVFRDAGDGTTDFYWAADSDTEPTSWTTLTLNRATTLGNTFDSTAAPNAGAYNSGTTLMTGNLKRVIVRYGTTVTVDFNPADWTSGSSWVSSATGETWTLQGGASITGGGSNTVVNTTANSDFATFLANSGIPLVAHDTLLVLAVGYADNTSGSAVNYTFDFQVNGVTLFTSAAVSVPTGAGKHPILFAGRVNLNTNAGDDLWCSAELAVGAAATAVAAPALGSLSMAADLSGGRQTGTARVVSSSSPSIPAFTTVPAIKVRCQMGTANANASFTRGFSQLYVAKA